VGGPPERCISVEQLPDCGADTLVSGGVHLDEGAEDRLRLVVDAKLR
jgi:hypothetical protein